MEPWTQYDATPMQSRQCPPHLSCQTPPLGLRFVHPRACITEGSTYAAGYLFPSAKPIDAQEGQAHKSSAFSAAMASPIAEARLQRQGASCDGDVRKAGGLVKLELAEL